MVETVILNKKSIFKRILIFITFFTSPFTYSLENYLQASDWILWKNSADIEIYYQTIPDTNLIRVKAKLEVESSLSGFLLFIQDIENLPSWLENAYKSKIIKQINVNENLFITYFYGLWPIEPRNTVMKTRIIQNDDLSIDIFSEDASDEVPQVPNSIRMKVLEAHWHLVAITDEKKIRIEYFIAVDPKGDIPTQLFKDVTLDAMFKTVFNIKQQLPYSRWQNFDLQNIREVKSK